MQVEDALYLGVVDAELAAPPQPGPRRRVPLQQGVEAPGPGDGRQRGLPPFLDGAVAGGEDGGDFLDGDRDVLLSVDGEVLSGPARFGQRSVFGRDGHPSAGRHRDPDFRRDRRGAQEQRFRVGRGRRLLAAQMYSRQVPVPLHTRVDDPSVQCGPDLERTGPVLGDDRGLQRGQVRIVHGHHAALGHAERPSRPITRTHEAGQDAAPEIEFLVVGEQPVLLEGAVGVEPLAVGGPERQVKPVRHVHQVGVAEVPPAHLGRQAVVAARHVGPRIVDVVRGRFGGGSSGGEVAVPKGAESFPQPLRCGVIAVIGQDPRGHRVSLRSRPVVWGSRRRHVLTG